MEWPWIKDWSRLKRWQKYRSLNESDSLCFCDHCFDDEDDKVCIFSLASTYQNVYYIITFGLTPSTPQITLKEYICHIIHVTYQCLTSIIFQLFRLYEAIKKQLLFKWVIVY